MTTFQAATTQRRRTRVAFATPPQSFTTTPLILKQTPRINPCSENLACIRSRIQPTGSVISDRRADWKDACTSTDDSCEQARIATRTCSRRGMYMVATERGLILALNAADRTHGYNISTEPSNNQLGLKRSDVTCRRIGAAKQGNQNRLGKLHSQETKDLIRQKLTGKTLSVETRAKLSAVRRGVPKSAEWMRKIIESSARTRANKLSRNTP
jgi:hypothetical protein